METNRRTELPTHDQVQLIREWGMKSKPRSDTGKSIPTASGTMFWCIIDMTYFCWQRAMDVRTLKESQIEDSRIRFTPSKTAKSSGKPVAITITPQIKTVIDAARGEQEKIRNHQSLPVPDAKGQAVHEDRPVFDVGPRSRACSMPMPPSSRRCAEFRGLCVHCSDAVQRDIERLDELLG